MALDNSLGAIFLGGIVASVFFGVSCLQTYLYYQRASEDTALLQTLVAILWMLDALDIALVIHALYYYMITGYARPLVLLEPTWSVITCILITGVIYVMVSSIYAWRIWIVSRYNWILVVFPVVLSYTSFGFSLAIAVNSFTLKYFSEIYRTASWMLYVALTMSVLSDFCIALSLCYFLRKGRTGFRTTDSLINRIMLYCISTSLVASTFALATLIAFATMRYNFIYVGIFLVIPHLHSNALLATLNARGRADSDPTLLTLRNFESSGACSTRVDQQRAQIGVSTNTLRSDIGDSMLHLSYIVKNDTTSSGRTIPGQEWVPHGAGQRKHLKVGEPIRVYSRFH